MFRLIFKTLWSRRKRNAWLLAELILVSILSWAIFDPVIVVTHDRMIPLGYDADRLCMVSLDMLQPSAPGYDSLASKDEAKLDSYLHLMRLARQHPDVEQTTALIGFSYPGSQGSQSTAYQVEGDTVKNSTNVYLINYLPHTHFFETYGFRSGTKGMTATELSDYPARDHQLVLDENTLEYYFHTDDPRGKRFWRYNEKDTTYTDIVGAVGTIKYSSERRPMAVAFVPMSEEEARGYIPADALILIRVKEGVSMDRFLHDYKPWMLQTLRAGNLYVRDLKTYRQKLDETEFSGSASLYRRNLLVAIFFLINLCLGVAGTFWLQTRTRREEIGVMLSFGSTPGHIIRLLLGEGVVLTTVATLVGCLVYLQYALSEGLSRGMNYFANLRQEYWTDFFGWHFLIVSLIVYAILLAVVSAGVFIPAWKISRIQPTEALRDE